MPPVHATGRKLSRVAIACLFVLLLPVLVMLSAYVFRHGIAAFTANRILHSYDLELSELEGLHIGMTSLTIESVIFHWSGDDQPLRLQGVELNYTASGLAGGTLESVVIDHASLHLPAKDEASVATTSVSVPAAAPTAALPTSRPEQRDGFIGMLQELPVQELFIETLDVEPYLDSATLHLVQSARDLQLSFLIRQLRLDAVLNWHDSDFVSAYFLETGQTVQPTDSLLSGRIEMSGQSESSGQAPDRFLTADLTITEQMDEADIHAALQLDIDGLQERLAAVGIMLPDALPAFGGNLRGDIRARIHPANGTMPEFQLQIDPISRLTASRIQLPAQEGTADIALALHAPVQISGRYPLENTGVTATPALRIEGNAMQLVLERLPGSETVNASISNLVITCEEIDACSAEHMLQLALASYRTPDIALQEVTFASAVNAELANGTVQLLLGSASDPASLTLRQLQAPGVELAQAQLRAADPLRLTMTDGAIALAGTQISLELPLIRTGSDISQLQLQLPRLALSTGNGMTLDTEFVALNMVTELVPVNLQSAVLEGELDYATDTVTVNGDLHLNGQLALQLAASHAVGTGAGNAALVMPGIHFDTLWSRLSNFISPLPVPVDLLSGSVEGRGDLRWQKDAQANWQFSGPVQFSLNDISGVYEEIGFLGVSTSAALELAQSGVRTAELHTLEIASIDPGIPVENIRMDYQVDTAAGRYTIRDFYAELFDGSVSSDGGVFITGNPSNTLLLNLQRINLESILDMAAYDAVTATGLVSGQLPLTLAETVTVSGGTLVALPPGGYIRYRPSGMGAGSGSGNAGLDLVYQALSNYQYDLLRANVNYQPDGDLLVEVKLEGVNPDMSPGGQAINLNLNIEDNIPALLESLQAARSITDALEARLQTTESQ